MMALDGGETQRETEREWRDWGTGWLGWVRGALFEQVNLGTVGFPPVCEKDGEYIDLCLVKYGGPAM